MVKLENEGQKVCPLLRLCTGRGWKIARGIGSYQSHHPIILQNCYKFEELKSTIGDGDCKCSCDNNGGFEWRKELGVVCSSCFSI